MAATGDVKRGPHSADSVHQIQTKNLGRVFRMWDGMGKGTKDCLIDLNL